MSFVRRVQMDVSIWDAVQCWSQSVWRVLGLNTMSQSSLIVRYPGSEADPGDQGKVSSTFFRLDFFQPEFFVGCEERKIF